MKPEDYFKKVNALDADEHTHQCALMCWASLNHNNDTRLMLLHAIPNGGERNKIVAARMKAEGVRTGVPDLFLPVPMLGERDQYHEPQYWHGLYIEMKRPSARLKRQPAHKWDTGGVREEQATWLTLLEQQGYKCVVCYHWYEAANEIYNYLTGRVLP